MAKTILVTGATGNQGGAVVRALAGNPNFTVLAVTRNPSSYAARDVSSKGQNIRLVQGDLNDPSALFQAAADANAGPVWGVFSVQTLGSATKKSKTDSTPAEVTQACGLVDESVKHGVKHFVYTSVDRGGEERSWNNPTHVPHFATKHQNEHYLRDHAESMGWTILRPTAFMENITPAFPTKVFMAALKNHLGPKKLQWISCTDIGIFAKFAFLEPTEYNHKAISLAGSDLSQSELCAVVDKKSATSIQPTFSVLGSVLSFMVSEVNKMLTWFASEGYGADIAALRKVHPGLLDFETWVEKESTFPKKA